MSNKVLVKLFVPELDGTYDLYIPVNEILWKVKELMVKSVSDLSGSLLNVNKQYILINKNTSVIYQNNSIIINTDIRNATELVLLTYKKEYE